MPVTTAELMLAMVSVTATGPRLATVTVMGTDADAVGADVGDGVGDVENRRFPKENHAFHILV